MAYNNKFREKVIGYIDKGHTIEEAHEVFEVGTTTIKEWKKLKKETGQLERRPLKRKHKKIDPVKLVAYLKDHPDSYQREIAEVFSCTQQAVFSALKRLGITRKKNETLCGKQ